MPKMKTHNRNKKRIKGTGNGKGKRPQAFKKHILTKKTAKRKRNLRKSVITSPANEANIKKMIPYM